VSSTAGAIQPGIVALLQGDTSGLSNAQLGLLVVTNAGFSNRPDLAMLVADAFSTYGSDHRGQVILDFAKLLLSLTADAEYGKNAVAFSSAVASNLAHAYSASTSSVSDRPTVFGSTDVTPPAPAPAPAPATTVLTTGIDILGGTSGNDNFVGDSATFGAADVIDGSAGIDTFTFNDTTGAAIVGQVRNVEVINLRNVSGGATTYAASSFAGATNINTYLSTGAVTVNGLTAGQEVGITGKSAGASGALTAAYGATVSSATLNVAGGTLGAASGVVAPAVTINGAAITSATIKSTGAANTVGAVTFGSGGVTALTINAATAFTAASLAGFGANAAITVAGAGTASIGTLSATVTSVNAAGNSGGLTTTLNALTNSLAVVGGSGNDVITTGAILAAGSSVDAGAGTADRLVIADTTHLTSSTAAFYRGFEQLGVVDGVTANVSLLAANNTINTVRITDGAGATGVTGLNAIQAGNVQITATGAAGAGVITIGVAGATDVGQIDTVRAAVTTTTAAGAANNIDLTGLTLAGVEKLALTGTGTVSATSGTINLTTTNATSLEAITLTTAGNSTITVAAGHVATDLAIDASASSGRVVVNAAAYAAGTGATIKGGSGNDTLLGSAGADIITGGAGNDLITGSTGVAVAGGTFTAITTGSAAADVLSGGAGKDVFGFGVGASIANTSSITDLDLGGVDAFGRIDTIVFDLATTSAATPVTVVTLSTGQQAAVNGAADVAGAANAALTAAGGMNNVALFTYGTDSYLIVNGDGNNTFDAAQDVLVKLTGVVGTLDASDITIV